MIVNRRRPLPSDWVRPMAEQNEPLSEAMEVRPSIPLEPAGVIADRVIKRTDYLSEQNAMLWAMWMCERTRRLDGMGHMDINFAEYSVNEIDEARQELKAWTARKHNDGIRAERQS